MTKTEDWQAERWELVRKLKEHAITLQEYNTEKRRLSGKAPNATAFAEEEQCLFSVPLDVGASAEAVYARTEGPPYVVRKSEENDE
jgi:hypothetical protein